jgi:short-subunit dehydrogenase
MSFAARYGPWALVTGASDGTGREFAEQIAAAGLSVVLVARRQGPLETVADEIRSAHGVECVTATVDLATPDADQQLMAAIGEREVGLYVANAGADPNGSTFLDRELAAWDELVQRNVVTTMRMCHHLGRAMRERRRGGILLVNSGACYGGGSHLAIYTATKAFELNFGESLWAELQPYEVDVLDVVLSMTDTPAFRTLLAEKGIGDVPPGTASPADVARVALQRLGQVPLHNWGLADDEQGMLPMSADARRERIAMGAWWEMTG